MGSAIRTRLIPAVMLLVIVLAIWWARRKPPETYSVAYVNDRSAIVWSTTAQVRERVADLKYGEKVAVLGHTGDETEVRGDDGTQGWVETQLLMSPDLWQHASDLLARARSMPVQASGHTRAVSNVHMEPSRTATRVFQFGRNVSVVVLDRKVVPVPAAAPTAPVAPAANAPAPGAADGAPEGDAAGAGGSESDEAQPKQEDWLLVLHVAQQSGGADAAAGSSTAATAAPRNGDGGTDGEDIPIAGWVLARFIELDPPAPIGDYATSAALRVVAWFVLNKVPGDGGGERPQYLVAGSRGGEGQPCDFTSLRVYTWGAARQRYETAYVENDLCGEFPIRTMETPDGAEFRFAEIDENNVERVYRMKQTIVRRVRENQPAASTKR
jgi:hypothetical protein